MGDKEPGNGRAAAEVGGGLGIIAAIVAAALAASGGLGGGSKSGAENPNAGRSPAATAHPTHEKIHAPKPKSCRRVSGILRVVGLDEDRMKDVAKMHIFGDPLEKVPGMLDERHDPRDKNVTLTSASYRISPKITDVTLETNFGNTVSSHFNSNPPITKSDKPLLGLGNTVTGHEYGINSHTVVEIIEVGNGQVCS